MTDLLRLHEDLARIVLTGHNVDEVLDELTTAARKAMVDVEAASITLIRGDKPFAAAYDGQLARAADELQYARGYGPCVDAGLAGQIMVIDDMAAEQRWPDYARHALAEGVGSAMSFPLPFQGTSIGALNTYASRPYAYREEDREVGRQVASWIALALAKADAAARTSEELEHLQIAMQSRAVIEQAKGILMERHKVTEEQAFNLLIRASQTGNVKLRRLAEELVRTGQLGRDRRC